MLLLLPKKIELRYKYNRLIMATSVLYSTKQNENFSRYCKMIILVSRDFGNKIPHIYKLLFNNKRTYILISFLFRTLIDNTFILFFRMNSVSLFPVNPGQWCDSSKRRTLKLTQDLFSTVVDRWQTLHRYMCWLGHGLTTNITKRWIKY